ncbi:hypothetical protein [uncultured Psychrosphaera sp.]|uniref:hypothetical protein n=1 Tax=uncultured Psychrosphaera sp. TaxID=1403522 RepID=UPI002635D224|nr:hypothetical protein [uncultured Psychrosphaera sp.]
MTDKYSMADFKLKTINELDQIQRISSAAKQAAMEEKPNSDSMNLDETERNIISYCEGEVQQANDLVYDKFSVFKRMMTKATKAISSIQTIKSIPEVFRSEYQYNIRKNSSEAKIIQGEFNLAKKDLYNFKTEHNLIRQEQSSTKPLLNWALVIAIVFAESILNASFFAKGSDLGLLGGVIQAFVIVMINVLVANLVVLLIRRRNITSLSSVKKTGYTFITGAMVFTTICFHFLVGHYRDALRIDFDNAYAFSVLNFSSSPFALIDFESYILVFMGLLFFALLIIDLYKIKDPYPGYSEISKKYYKIKDEFDSLNMILLDDENAMLSDMNKKIEMIKLEATDTYEEIQDIHIVMQKLENKYNGYLNSMQSLAVAAIRRYRSMNSDMRTTPSPEYFEHDIEFNPVRIEFEYADNKEKTALLESAIENLPVYEREAKDNLNKVVQELKDSAELLGNDTDESENI